MTDASDVLKAQEMFKLVLMNGNADDLSFADAVFMSQPLGFNSKALKRPLRSVR